MIGLYHPEDLGVNDTTKENRCHSSALPMDNFNKEVIGSISLFELEHVIGVSLMHTPSPSSLKDGQRGRQRH